jgi:hypothetical protein
MECACEQRVEEELNVVRLFQRVLNTVRLSL